MGTQDKVVVRRFIENVASGRDISVADDVLAPGYINLAFQGVDIAGLKAMTAALYAAVDEARTDSLELVAEGDAVFARFDYAITLRDGSERTPRGLAYYHLTDGRIDVNDVMMMPDLHKVLGPLMGSPPTDQ